MIRNQMDRERGLPVLTVFCALWCIAVFLMINFQKDATWSGVARWGYLRDSAIYNGAWWGLITSAFVHIEPVHLLFNIYWLWILGGALERAVGPLRWLIFVLFAAFISSGLELLSGTTGIGLSGVGYALFGFAWLTRRRYPEFAIIANNQTAQIFIGWGLLCIVLTYLKIMNVGNVAHFSGLAFGMAVGAFVTVPNQRVWFSLGITALLAGAILPLFWSPFSEEWVSQQAGKAHEKRQYSKAIGYYKRSLQLGADKVWVWSNLARIYGIQEDAVHYKEAIEELKTIDYEEARVVTNIFGIPK